MTDSDYESIQKSRNIVVGVFVIVAVCSLVWLVFKFGDLPTAVSRLGSFQVFVQFPTAPGVETDTPVRFCGFQIGSVTKVKAPQILRDLNTGLEYHQTVVVLSINKKYVNIPSNVKVKLMTRGLGSSYIELAIDPTKPKKPLDSNRPETVYLVDKISLQGSTGMTSEFFPEESQKKLDELADDLKNFMKNANDIIGDANNKENIRTTLTNLSHASEQLTGSLKEFREFSTGATHVSEELSKTVVQLRLILEKINTGQGTAARFVNDGRLYENLLENTQQLEVLLEQLNSFVTQSRDKGLPLKLK